MSLIYTSPIAGIIDSDIYYSTLSAREDYLRTYSRVMGVRRIIIPAIIKVERKFGDQIVKGQDIYDALIRWGYSESVAGSVVNTLYVNSLLVDDMLSESRSEMSTLYTYDLVSRLKYSNLAAIPKYRKWYYLEQEFIVHPIDVYEYDDIPEEPEEPDEPEETELWRRFEVSMLMSCRTNKPRDAKRELEFRGLFYAKESEILDFESYNSALTTDNSIVRTATEIAEVLLMEYCELKGYDFFETCGCSDARFNGIDPLESQEAVEINISELENFKTRHELDIWDMDYNTRRFSDTLTLTGRWWENKAECIKQLRLQLDRENRH